MSHKGKYISNKKRGALERRVWLYPADKFSYHLYNKIFQRKLKASKIIISDEDRILVLAPHQDDEILGAGGVLLSCRSQKTVVQPVFVTEGKGRPGIRTDEERTKLSQTRQDEAKNVSIALQALPPINLGFDEPDLINMSLENTSKLSQKITDVVINFKPTIVLSPFFTDTHFQHLVTTVALANIPKEYADNVKVMLYKTHAHIPDKFVNSYFALTPEMHKEKERVLHIYKSQKMNVDITLKKYLLHSLMVPGNLKKSFHSIEFFSCISFSGLVELSKEYRNDPYLMKNKGIFYAPYSFKNFLYNQVLYLLSPVSKRGLRTRHLYKEK